MKIELKQLWKLFWAFFKIGAFTFGGGLAMLPLIEKEVVEKQKWANEEDTLEIFALSQSLPGVIAVNTSIFIGNKVAGLAGSITALAAITLPAFLSIILVLLVLMQLENNPIVEKVFMGIRAASAALIMLTAIKLGKSAMKDKAGIVIGIASFLIIVIFNISAAWAIILGGAAGYVMYLFNRRASNGHNS